MLLSPALSCTWGVPLLLRQLGASEDLQPPPACKDSFARRHGEAPQLLVSINSILQLGHCQARGEIYNTGLHISESMGIGDLQHAGAEGVNG